MSKLVQDHIGRIAPRRARIRRDGDDARAVGELNFCRAQQSFREAAAVLREILNHQLIGRLPFLGLVQPLHGLPLACAHADPFRARVHQTAMHRLAAGHRGLAPLPRRHANLVRRSVIYEFPLQRIKQVLWRKSPRPPAAEPFMFQYAGSCCRRV